MVLINVEIYAVVVYAVAVEKVNFNRCLNERQVDIAVYIYLAIS